MQYATVLPIAYTFVSLYRADVYRSRVLCVLCDVQ